MKPRWILTWGRAGNMCPTPCYPLSNTAPVLQNHWQALCAPSYRLQPLLMQPRNIWGRWRCCHWWPRFWAMHHEVFREWLHCPTREKRRGKKVTPTPSKSSGVEGHRFSIQSARSSKDPSSSRRDALIPPVFMSCEGWRMEHHFQEWKSFKITKLHARSFASSRTIWGGRQLTINPILSWIPPGIALCPTGAFESIYWGI